jgi:spore maturation protein CgeB
LISEKAFSDIVDLTAKADSKDVKTPFENLIRPDHALKRVAMCASRRKNSDHTQLDGGVNPGYIQTAAE